MAATDEHEASKVMVFSIIALVLLIGLTYILVAPLIIEIESVQNVYRIRLFGIAKAELLFAGFKPQIRLSVLGWRKQINVLKTSEQRSAAKKAPREKKADKKKILRKAIKIMQSFRLRYLYVDLDTDNYLLNANLYPVAKILSTDRCMIRINFHGINAVKLRITNSVGRMLYAYIK